MTPEAPQKTAVYPPGMDARSTRVAERLNTPMLIAAALTLPMVAISESHPGGALEDVGSAFPLGQFAGLEAQEDPFAAHHVGR